MDHPKFSLIELILTLPVELWRTFIVFPFLVQVKLVLKQSNSASFPAR